MDGSGESGEIADDAATERDDMIAARHIAIEQPIAQLLQPGPAFCAFAGIDHMPVGLAPAGRKRLFERCAMERMDVAIADHRHPLCGQEVAGQFADPRDQAASHHDVVTRRRCRDSYPIHRSIHRSIPRAISSATLR